MPLPEPLGVLVPCTVVVLTLNEARNLPDCLRSLAAFDDVHVLDSGSTDATCELAESLGARVSTHRFESFARQRNWAHDHLPLAHDWVLHLDADERMTPTLAREIATVVARAADSVGGYLVAERTLLDGRWLRRAAQYPRFQARLVHRHRMRFVDAGHGQRERSDLPFERLSEPYDHLAFANGLEHWLCKHAAYAMREAEAALGERLHFRTLLHSLVGGDALRRRRALKLLAMHLPLRPWLRWAHVALVHGGWRDGAAGLQYARMMRAFQEMIDLRMHELRLQQRRSSEADGRCRPG